MERVDENGLRQAAASSRRLVVFLTVDWSGPERVGRRLFAEFSSLFKDDFDVRFVIAPEECELAHAILRSRDATPGGWGPIAWIKDGAVIDVIERSSNVHITKLLERTREAFGSAAGASSPQD